MEGNKYLHALYILVSLTENKLIQSRPTLTQIAAPASTSAVIESILDKHLIEFPTTRELLLSTAQKCDFDEPLSAGKLNKLAGKLIESLAPEESRDHPQN